jgi:copper(I)-binding protein
MRTVILTVFSFLFFINTASAQVSVQIDPKAWLREGPPNARVLAAFISMQNTGKKTLILKAVHGKDFDHVEMHKTIMQNGMARMIPQPRLVIKAGQTLKMQPGGIHIMLFKPKRAIKAGEQITLTLDFGKSGKKSISIPVRKGGKMMHHHHHN